MIIDYKAKDQSMRIPPEEGIRNANVLTHPVSYNHIIRALKHGKKHIMDVRQSNFKQRSKLLSMIDV